MFTIKIGDARKASESHQTLFLCFPDFNFPDSQNELSFCLKLKFSNHYAFVS